VLCIPVRVIVGAIPVVSGASFISAWGFTMVNALGGTCGGGSSLVGGVDGGSY